MVAVRFRTKSPPAAPPAPHRPRRPARAVLAAAWLAGAPAGAGCGGEPGAPAAAEGPIAAGPTPTAISPAPAPDDTLIVAVRRLPTGLDPLSELDPWGQRVADDLLFEGLVRRRTDAAPWAESALAERCEPDPAARGFACRLREGAEFHDGSPVTREDVLYSAEQWLGPRGQALRQRYGLDGLRAAEAIDGPPGGPKDSSGRWVRLSFEQDDPLALEKLAAIKIVPRARHQAGGSFAAQPIGSGPLRLLAQDDVQLTFERVTPAPGLAKRIALRAIDDGAAALTALRRGEVHVLAEVAPVHVPKELAKPAMASRFVAYLVSPPRYDLALFNLREGVQAGPRMRQALDLATPRGELAQQVYGLRGLPAAVPVDLHAPAPIDLVALAEGRDAEAGLGPLAGPPDANADAAGRAAADAILTELGWIFERGVRRRQTATLRLPLTWDPSPGLATGVARALRAGWKQIGIQAPSVTASWGYVVTNLLRAGKFSVALVRLAGASDHDLAPWFHSKGAHNLTGLADGILDAALDAYRLAATRADRDAAKRAIADRLAALRPAIVLHAPVAVTLFSRAVTGIAFADDLPRLDRLGFAAAPAEDAR
mgnify:CR=1 FL=1